MHGSAGLPETLAPADQRATEIHLDTGVSIAYHLVGDEDRVAAQLRRFAEARVTEFFGFQYRDSGCRLNTDIRGRDRNLNDHPPRCRR